MVTPTGPEYSRATIPANVELASKDVVLDGVQGELLSYLAELAQVHIHLFDKPLVVTSGKEGQHVQNSKHYLGRAIDLRSEDKNLEEQVLFAGVLAYFCRIRGVAVFDERAMPSGPHWHVELAG